jgi:hypothetical protein
MTRLHRIEFLISFGAALTLVILLAQTGEFPSVLSPFRSLTNSERFVHVQTIPVTRRMVKYMMSH